MTGPGRPHWIRPNESTTGPNAYVYLDTEAHRDLRVGVEDQTWRLGVAAFDRRASNASPWLERQWCETDDVATLWDQIEAWAPHNARVVLVCHNLAYDLRISQAFTQLPGRGWDLARLRLDAGQAQAVWRRGRQSLVCVDSTSWLPTSLAKVASLVRITKPGLPMRGATDAEWLERCRADVEILAEAWRRIINWIEVRELAAWKPTGAATGWGVWRHTHYTHKVLAHGDPELREAERAGAATGRCEAWRHGRLDRGAWTEWDYRHAYASIAAESDVPVRLIAQRNVRRLAQLEAAGTSQGVLAKVTVSTDVPTVPAFLDGRWCWPVGTFETTLWWPEIALALDHGATVVPTWAARYEMAPALQAWARWCIDLTQGYGDGADPVVAAVAKGWSRSVIGRFGMRYVDWSELGQLPEFAIRAGVYRDDDTGASGRTLQVGHRLLVETGLTDGDDSAPQVMSWVMMLGRIRLWRAMEAAGLENLGHVDTDGLLVNATGTERLLQANIPNLRRKRSYDRAQVLGPRQVITEAGPSIQGLPRGAVKVGADQWRGEAWERLGGALQAGRTDTVRIVTRTVTVRGKDARRQETAAGHTEAIRVDSAT